MNIGDKVRVTHSDDKYLNGMLGRLAIIEPHNDSAGDFYGVDFGDGLAYFFRADELTVIEKGGASGGK